MTENWFIITITGVSCAGKSVLSTYLYNNLPASTRLLRQDDYFVLPSSPKDTSTAEGNWDMIQNHDMDRMLHDIRSIIDYKPVTKRPPISYTNMASADIIDRGSFNAEGVAMGRDHSAFQRSSVETGQPILLLEGFCLLDDPRLVNLSDLVILITVDKAVASSRRSLRRYETPDVDGYFEECVWPMAIKYEHRCQNKYSRFFNLLCVDGDAKNESFYNNILAKVIEAISGAYKH